MNKSGITPLLERVLVLPDEIEEHTTGGIYIPEPVAERHQQAQATGTFIAAGPDAFIHSRVEIERVINGTMQTVEVRTERYNPAFIPKPGDRVQFAKYGGLENEGADGKTYRVLNDRDITTLVDEGVTYTGIQAREAVGGKR